MTFGFSNEEYAIIIGTVLGDSHIQVRGNGGTGRMRVVHSESQKDYLLWKHSKLANLCRTTQGPREQIEHERFKSWWFQTGSSPQLKQIHSLFYKWRPKPLKGVNRFGKEAWVKTITPELIRAFPKDPVMLAVWFMDDGSHRGDCEAGKLATQCFSLEENRLLQRYLLEVWGIESTTPYHVEADNTYSLNLSASTFGKFKELIRPTVSEVPCMLYKLEQSQNPVTTEESP